MALVHLLELAYFPASDAFLANHNLLNEVRIFPAPPGQLFSFNGIDLSTNLAYLATMYDNVTSHDAHEIFTQQHPQEIIAITQNCVAPGATPVLHFLNVTDSLVVAQSVFEFPFTGITRISPLANNTNGSLDFGKVASSEGPKFVAKDANLTAILRGEKKAGKSGSEQVDGFDIECGSAHFIVGTFPTNTTTPS